MSGPVQTYEKFAAERGLVTDADVQGHIHAGLMAAHMPNSYHRWYRRRLLELQEQRGQGQRAYAEAISAGDILPPTELTRRERLELTANGHPDLASTQAAIRLLARVKEPAEVHP